MRRGLFVILLISSISCAARVERPRLAPGTRQAAEQLRRDLHVIFTAPELDHANWGVALQSLATGDTLFATNPFKLLLPASNQKLLTTAVAAERLGWDYRFTTRLVATGPIDATGTLRGDLVVVGSGDPSINPRHESRMRAFDDWAAALQARGLNAIAGRIVGDDNAFEEPGLGFGWAWDNLPYGYGTAIGALQFNENQIAVRVTPGATAGAAATVNADPPGHALVIDARVTTAAAGAENTVDILRIPGSATLVVSGQIALDAKPSTMTASVENPTRFFVNALQDALLRHGITAWDAVDIDDLPGPLDTQSATDLLVDRSPPLSEIIDVCLKWSRNEYAETLLRALAPPGQPATAAAGLDTLRAQLGTWGVLPGLYAPRDGSGLSRQDYLAPQALISLLTYLWMDPRHADLFRSTLPVSGVSGSLAERMKGTPIEGRVWAKTGTLSNVRALSGYLLTRAGEPVVFAMMANNYQVPTAEIDAAMERALLRVYEHTR